MWLRTGSVRTKRTSPYVRSWPRRAQPRIDSEAVTTDSHERIMRLAIQRFVEEKAESLNMAELADALDSLEQTAALFLEYLRSKGIVGDPIAVQ